MGSVTRKNTVQMQTMFADMWNFVSNWAILFSSSWVSITRITHKQESESTQEAGHKLEVTRSIGKITVGLLTVSTKSQQLQTLSIGMKVLILMSKSALGSCTRKWRWFDRRSLVRRDLFQQLDGSSSVVGNTAEYNEWIKELGQGDGDRDSVT